MIDARRFTHDQIRKIQQACCRIFLHDNALKTVEVREDNAVRLRIPFLESLTWEEVRRAYRANVLSYHPDRHQDKPPEEIEALSRHLEHVNRSYELLGALFGKARAICMAEAPAGGKIIAVAGAKGGTGKSVFSANLGMLLHRAGWKTVVVDLDLGGADLHVYLGEKCVPEVTINDFINRRVERLSDTVVRKEHRPMLIAGNCAELGIANIPFMKKIRLIEKIRRMNVDYVVLDLGAGTDFNTLDFFLCGDYGIVISTLDQPAYLEAYAFMKSALQRRLTRLFSADSSAGGTKSGALKEIVEKEIRMPKAGNSGTVRELLDAVGRCDPVSLPLIADEIMNFTPHLVINRCFDTGEARRIAETIRSVARQRLSIEVNYLGAISKHLFIERSTSHVHHPLVERRCCSPFAGELSAIIHRLGISA
ncbi:MAG: Flagellum site-determining protein YlxH [Deltaproteobacteria bacterium ADurb.BinA179]|nr:P-loop NTPase [Deltaproteobacteria bacterium]MDI9544196.1 P-loop NTPase [Pseudomonadota bacterium]OPZ30311.1 MAG: Flagellum site-determining protein YlxH [Deltaproteobacteria bacterium ADurb.BinA179]HOD69832.1 P-loop NTPase [Deltaproteobacteria bacterium]HOE71652.1 P-loop NTPase [Deltaproteobacteria bacterium]